MKNLLIVLAKTPEIHSDVIICRQDCPKNLRETFLNALLKVKPELTPEKMTFLPAKNEDFDSVAAVMEFIGQQRAKKK
jgi:ABC-type phosphate/phosphonate transport system substrate-binding protein